MKISPPYKVKEIIVERNYPGYIYRREIVDDSDYGGDGNLEMVNCYSSDTGDWISDAKTARFLCDKKGLRQIQKAHPSHCIASIGYNEKQKRWYGWSHRAICGFGNGHKIFEANFGDDKTPFKQHGKITIATPGQAKLAAKRFSNYVS